MIRAEVVRSPERFLELEGPWNAVLEGSGRDDPFLRHEWFRAIVTTRPVDLRLVLLWDGSDLVGIVPLDRRTGRIRHVPVRELGFLSVPDTFHADVLFTGKPALLWSALVDTLEGPLRREWDTLLLAPWPEASPQFLAPDALGRVTSRPAASRVWSQVPVIRIDRGWDDFWKTRSPMFRKSQRGIANRIERLGRVELRCLDSDPDGSAVETLVGISLKSWKAGKGIALGGNPEQRAFFRALTRTASRLGWLRVWTLHVNDAPVAIEYHLACRGVEYALRAEFDESLRSVSPGSYLHYRITQRLFEDGTREYNLGPGLNPYKLRWTDTVRTNVGATVFNRGIRPRAAYLLEGFLAPRLKRLVRRSDAA